MKASPVFIRRVVYALATILLVVVLVIASVFYFEQGFVDRMPRTFQAEADLQILARKLAAYEAVFGNLPSTTQGLDALVHKPPNATIWYQQLEQLPKDPWGHFYLCRIDSSVPKSYDLFSLGPDGVKSADDIHFHPDQ